MKQSSRFLLSLATAGLLLGAVGAAWAEEADMKPSRQSLLRKEVDLAAPQITTNVIRVTFPAGSKVSTHTHPGPGPRYVLKGKLKVVDAGQTQVYTAGDVFWETGREMTVENVAGDESQMVIFEMAPRTP